MVWLLLKTYMHYKLNVYNKTKCPRSAFKKMGRTKWCLPDCIPTYILLR